jgi:hypothetical protein
MYDSLVDEQRKLITDPGYLTFLDSDDLSKLIDDFSNFHQLDQSKRDALENALILYLLFLLTEEQCVGFISRQCDLDEETAAILLTGLKISLPPDIRLSYEATYEQLQAAQNAPSLGSEIAETEAALAQVAPVTPLRTMARDVKDLESQAEAETPAYRSEQPTINRAERPPRWGG